MLGQQGQLLVRLGIVLALQGLLRGQYNSRGSRRGNYVSKSAGTLYTILYRLARNETMPLTITTY